MKNLITIFENFKLKVDNDVTVNDAAWLYLLYKAYNGKLHISRWENDTRMGVNSMESFNKFDFVTIDHDNDTVYINDTDECTKVLDKFFKMSFMKSILYKKNNKSDTVYPLEKIPYEYFMYNNPNLEKAFDVISERIVAHFNSQRVLDHIIDKLSKSRHIKKWNMEKVLLNHDENVEYIDVYRGIKDEYREDYTGKYSAWTTDINQAIRFAKHHFTGGTQFDARYSKNPHLLSTKIKVEDIVIYIGGDESEIILRNPISNVDVKKLKPGNKTE